MRSTSTATWRPSLIACVFIAVLVVGATPATAALTEPAYGAVVRGVVTVTEDQGGFNPCGREGYAATRLVGQDNSHQAFRETRWGGGPLTLEWPTVGRDPNGLYTIRSEAIDVRIGWPCFQGGWELRDLTTVHLDNRAFIAYDGDTSAVSGDLIEARAVVTLEEDYPDVEGRTVQFCHGGACVEAVTDADGVAHAFITASGSDATLIARHDGDAYFSGAEAEVAIDVARRATAAAVVAPADGYYAEDVTFVFTLRDTYGDLPLAGATLEASFADATATLTTDAAGEAVWTTPATALPGAYDVAVAFAGDDDHAPSAATHVFTILKRPTSVAYTGPTAGYRGSTVVLSADVTDARASTVLAGIDVTFALAGRTVTAVTDDQGRATAAVALDFAPATYTLDVTTAATATHLAGATSVPFDVLWEYVFTDANGAGEVRLNPSTKEFQVALPSGTSAITHDAGMRTTPWGVSVLRDEAGDVPPPPLPAETPEAPETPETPEHPEAPETPSGHLVTVLFASRDVSLAGNFELTNGAFGAAAAVTGDYAVLGRA